MSSQRGVVRSHDVAIIGMAGRFPGAPTLADFWRTLRAGVESVTVFSKDDLRAAGVAADVIDDDAFVKAGGVLADAGSLNALLADAQVLIAAAKAGVEVVSAAALAKARELLVAADVNAVPPAGVAGVGVMDKGAPLKTASGAVGIGALAVGNVKYQAQHRLLVRLRDAGKPLSLGFADAFQVAREVLAEG